MKATPSSRKLWRSVAEFSDPVFRTVRHDEFQAGDSEPSGFNRRDFLKLLGATAALAGLPACTRQPVEKIVPYVKQPEELVPGNPLFYATAMTLGGFATGLIVESHEGHPTKNEGNPDHPASRGATNIFHQASMLDLYDPDRAQGITRHGEPETWDNFVSLLGQNLDLQKRKNGAGLRILTETVTSPTLYRQLQSLFKKYPEAKWHQFEPINRDNVLEGSRMAFGEIVETHYHFDRAKIIVSLDADFLYTHPNSVRYAGDFASRRRAPQPDVQMNRLYVLESSPSVTGSNADHRLPLVAGDIEAFTRTLAQRIGVMDVSENILPSPEQQRWIEVVSADLLENRGAAIVVAGANQPATVHALVHAMNHVLGNAGQTVTYSETAQANAINQNESLQSLASALNLGAVDILVILGGNPVFTAPADLEFATLLPKANLCVHLSPDFNETSKLCDWHVPQNHFLESWSDARAFDGTISIVQPLILPLYGGKSPHEILDAMILAPGRTDYEVVREYWDSQNGVDEIKWRRALHDGFFAETTMPSKTVALQKLPLPPPKSKSSGEALEITFRPDPTLFDGRSANNGWLQELPKPVTKLTWDNAALISPNLAAREKLQNGDVIEIVSEGRRLNIPIWITPGQPDRSVALHLGNGRRTIGRVGQGMGFDVNILRTSRAFWFADGAGLNKTGKQYQLVTTQAQHTIDSEDRQIFREGTLAMFQNDPAFVKEDSESPPPAETLFNPKEYQYSGYRWGMAIDLTACIGCNACILACQSENNIPVVGKDQVARGRVMHWIRVDTYFSGALETPAMNHQPVPCMHCENAPCELVCPVGATLHDKEGLNLQVYNRCVGTRYCSNNCPYKVRRFNFYQFADYKTPSLKPMWNPNVTVRSRGVMEKCTYCIQRISMARIKSEEQNRKVADGEIKTACQQVCPARAIVFGDIGDSESEVAKLKRHDLNFSMLGELNTRPRTTYLAKLRNPNPKLPA
jgi:molybdopterin-containing oxidoreductase family iron-sulfur binding subunit